MESTELNILDLNDYCLGHVLKCLDIEDHVRFAQVCTRFREVLRDWSNVLYPEFEIDTDSDNVEWKLKLLTIIGDVVKRLFLDIRQVDPEAPLVVDFSVDDLCNQIKNMQNLKYFAIKEGLYGHLVIIASRNKRKPKNEQLIEKTLAALEFLPQIRSVSLSCKTDKYNASSLAQMTSLQRVSMDTKIASSDLVNICKSNTDLRILWLREVVGELVDIVPHCKSLEEIAFGIFGGHNSYAELAELPNIKKVIIRGTSSTSPCTKTMELFSAFASKKGETPLQSLVLFSNLDFEETSKLIELTFLKELRCAFDDANCIDLLTALTDLEGLYIMLGRSGAGAKECLNILKSCKKLQRLHINSNLSTDFVEKALEVLRTVRNPKKQKPLQLYSTGVMHLCKENDEKLVDNDYCTLVNHSEYLRRLTWRFPYED